MRASWCNPASSPTTLMRLRCCSAWARYSPLPPLPPSPQPNLPEGLLPAAAVAAGLDAVPRTAPGAGFGEGLVPPPPPLAPPLAAGKTAWISSGPSP
jgi:hypothetical protein